MEVPSGDGGFRLSQAGPLKPRPGRRLLRGIVHNGLDSPPTGEGKTVTNAPDKRGAPASLLTRIQRAGAAFRLSPAVQNRAQRFRQQAFCSLMFSAGSGQALARARVDPRCGPLGRTNPMATVSAHIASPPPPSRMPAGSPASSRHASIARLTTPAG